MVTAEAAWERYNDIDFPLDFPLECALVCSQVVQWTGA